VTGYAIDDFELGDDVKLVTLSGDLGRYAAPALKERIDDVLAADVRCVLVQLADGTVIDSTVLGLLLGTLRQLRSRGCALRLVCSDPNLVRIFTLTGLDRTFDIYTRLADARLACGSDDPAPA